MSQDNFNLNKLIDLKKWDNLQDSLAEVTRVAIIIVDYKGNPVTKHSGCNRFCKEVRSNPNLVKYCQKCDSRGGIEAVRLNEPYIYLCHYNIIDIAIPIMIDGKYIGAVMAGQVKLSDNNVEDVLEKIAVLSKNSIAEKALDDFKTYYDELPVLSYYQVKKIANMLFAMCNYLVEEALEKNLILDIYKKTIKNHTGIDSNILTGYTMKNIENVKKEMSNTMINAYVEDKISSDRQDIKVTDILKPAIEYIYDHKSENVKLEKMAKICHISPSYFSRLFKKETGENFSNYVSKLKIEWAKSLLEETDMQVNEISDELGFSESGYFIKIFKKYEGVTPFLYMKYCKKE
ncbi:regulatory protein PocR [Clostridium pasteurianum DSM 525 = ATCC 6013]|uniref:Regulatory protein PocR n=1 Tax=Clostridium pasteurianum DSM 525 = ATCC 6013 TaxID=1262449 RepID=A0A0H3J1N3_CLOPA|nr:PocR ligand-binding domain-containing protein [Clostridium pasteurianum]AJA47314.1 regulatory protein PocR [Clostridium pasteurianum DSM 525 = ATCC 6013]AJA51302.1 regulatory protein PocR [Clostridium pasteurianum DSM 525 = ATCC 6013]AOZ74653.1 transcriptional regulator [Clostridium pasteurianum DSM 525 = ATCC 6013]AOZ78450.1 transcriptional regulator [Clostridium pasteurianum]ELP58651.1 AraC family transcriptional regulator [Clostridium pasteurianum DSM 525 = ATCC 6013]